MKLATALHLMTETSKELPTKNVFLACGFTPLHLQTFLTAHLQLSSPESHVVVTTGLYGDLVGNIARIPQGAPAAIVIEWPDLDPRLGFRSLGGWSAGSGEDILNSVRSRLDSLAEKVRKASHTSTLTLVLPRKPMAPAFHTPHWMADRLALGIRRSVAEFAEANMEPDRVRILNSDALDLFVGEAFQLKTELANDFPYSIAYADFLAEKIALSLNRSISKKGLITDLDETLWAGILGEDGLEGVNWTLEGNAQVHGLYQQMLASLAESGVLLGVASKNDPAIAEQALATLALAVKSHQLFPKVANWRRKSHSVEAILKTWNIGAQDVVFIDDSAAELEEVKSAFPEMTCIQFKGKDVPYSHSLLLELRCLFGKPRIYEEDAIRSLSLRTAEKFGGERESAASEDDFLAALHATITFGVENTFDAGRALDLVNKTNQFNLNGRRYELAEWLALGSRPERSLLVIEYRDKHGSLGKIGVLSGVNLGRKFKVDAWVMSCRAFARRIEYATLDFLFQEFDLEEIELAHEVTSKNGPFRDFLEQICGRVETGVVKIDRNTYMEKRLPFFHEIGQPPRVTHE